MKTTAFKVAVYAFGTLAALASVGVMILALMVA